LIGVLALHADKEHSFERMVKRKNDPSIRLESNAIRHQFCSRLLDIHERRSFTAVSEKGRGNLAF
jgi:DNA-binding NtrC family response regulator